MPGPAPAALRRALRAALPDFMVPSHVVVLAALPSTAQGKVDRVALPAPDWARLDREGSLVEPRTPIERELVAIWADVLGLEAVGATDAFIDLGGNSLHASEIVCRVLARFHLALSVGALLRAGTVEAMAMVIAEALVAGAGRPIDAIVDALRSADSA
jgi:phosphopantetheine binding protein